MPHSETAQQPLIVDADPEFLEAVHRDPYASVRPPLIAASGVEAQLKLSDPSRELSGVFINASLPEPGALSVIRCAHAHRAGTPVFLLCSKDESVSLSPGELRALAVHQIVRKPISYADLVALVSPLLTMFDAERALLEARKNHDPVDVEISADDPAFTPILAERFLSGRKSFFDVYIRLRSGRYVKILQAGDAFSGERLLAYVRKGVLHFYIRKEAQESYVSYCAHLSGALLRSPEAPIELKTEQILNFGEETMRFLLDTDLAPAHARYAVQFGARIVQLAEQLRTHDFVRDYLRDVEASSHGVATAMVSALLLHAMQVSSEKLRNSIGMAAFLHDIGLLRTAPHLQHEDELKMSMEDMILYESHASVGSQLLAQVREMDAIALQAVAHHHRRRDGKGFPDHGAPGAGNRMAELVGISDELVRAVSLARSNPRFRLLDHMEKRVFHGFSYPVIHAFRTIFMPSSRA